MARTTSDSEPIAGFKGLNGSILSDRLRARDGEPGRSILAAPVPTDPPQAPQVVAARKGRFLLSVVVPVYNEEQVIGVTHERLMAVLGRHEAFDLELVYVNDGSRDASESILHEMADRDRAVRVISFSRNFGHQPAVSAGLSYAAGDAVAVIDADLQDPPDVLVAMIERWRFGYDVIYGVRASRKEGAVKRAAYALFYRIYSRLADIEVSVDSGDFCLLDRRVVDVMNLLPEKNRFMRGLRSWAGFRQTGLVYERHARAGGETKYSFGRLLKLAFDGIVNFSTAPLRYIFIGGVGMFLTAALALVFLLIQRLSGFTLMGVRPQDVPGWTSLILAFLAFSGAQLVSIGILGEYLGRIYQEVKNRPSYVVKDIHSGKSESDDEPSRLPLRHERTTAAIAVEARADDNAGNPPTALPSAPASAS
jgi:dolichol-phosphate mannosyltransferase